MKSRTLLLSGFLALLLLTGCAEEGANDEIIGDGLTTTLTAAPLRNCGPAVESDQANEPDRTSIENLFGCVTLTKIGTDGENSTSKSVVFTADSEGGLIAGGRSVRGMLGRTPIICAEVIFGFADFLCTAPFLGTTSNYVLTMDSQFEGSGTVQLCIIDGECGLNGVEFSKEPASISIVRDPMLVADGTTMNGLPITDIEAHDHELANALQFRSVPSSRSLVQSQYVQDVLSELEVAMKSFMAE